MRHHCGDYSGGGADVPATGPLRPRASDGSEVDATFELSVVPVFDLVYHHKAGARGSERSVNADYHEGLELLLCRLAELELTILGIAVDSSVARELDPADRELDVPFPIDLRPEMDMHELRLTITRAQKPVARRPGVVPSGGNDQKRIRITLTADNAEVSFEALRRHLLDGTGGSAMSRGVEARDDVGRPTSRATSSPARRVTPTVKDLMAAGLLPPGTVVLAQAQGRQWRATLLASGKALLDGESSPRRFGLLTNFVAGYSESAMRLWSAELDGVQVPLHVLRDKLADTTARESLAPASAVSYEPDSRAPRAQRSKIDFVAAEQFIASVPLGRWTSYKDVAGFAGSASGALAIGRWLADNGERIPGVWRVLTTAGVVSPGWRAGAASLPQTPAAVHQLLAAEGVTFKKGRAVDAARWTPDDFERARLAP